MKTNKGVVAWVKEYFTAMPIIFPLIGLFHIWYFIYLCYEWINRTIDFSLVYWLQPVVLGIYMVFWIDICYRKKKAANGYLIFTILALLFFFFGPKYGYDPSAIDLKGTIKRQAVMLYRAVGDLLIQPIPINILFCFLVLFYYRRLRVVEESDKKTLSSEQSNKEESV